MQLMHAWQAHYQEMLQELNHCRRLHFSAPSRTAYCFKICMDHWQKIQKHIATHTFASQTEEIHFFKIVKPKYTSLIEYYTMVYHAELFRPPGDEELQLFWRKENARVARFHHEHAAFCSYYKSGCTSMDHVYFKRCNHNCCSEKRNMLYDADGSMIASHGYLATSLLAYEMYEVYVLQQMTNKV
jgi:hypothetical protein